MEYLRVHPTSIKYGQIFFILGKPLINNKLPIGGAGVELLPKFLYRLTGCTSSNNIPIDGAGVKLLVLLKLLCIASFSSYSRYIFAIEESCTCRNYSAGPKNYLKSYLKPDLSYNSDIIKKWYITKRSNYTEHTKRKDTYKKCVDELIQIYA